jgi:hypothetical protein
MRSRRAASAHPKGARYLLEVRKSYEPIGVDLHKCTTEDRGKAWVGPVCGVLKLLCAVDSRAGRERLP